MADNIDHLPFAGRAEPPDSRGHSTELVDELGMMAFLIPPTLFGLQIGIPVLFHAGSTLTIVANALRLLAYRDKSLEAPSALTP